MKEDSIAKLMACFLIKAIATTVIINATMISAIWIFVSFVRAEFYPMNFMAWPDEFRLVIALINAVLFAVYICVIYGLED